MSATHVPEGYQSVTPYLIVPDVDRLLTFLEEAFDATVIERVEADGAVNHAEVMIGTSMVMMGQAREEHPAMSVMLYVYLEDCDATYARALEAGATSEQEPRDEFYGDRTAAVKGPGGNHWYLATRKENLTTEEIQERAAKVHAKADGDG